MTELTELKGNFEIDPAHSSLAFVARHAMITKVRGTFDDFSGKAVLDGDDPSASGIEVSINVASVDTRVGARDNHLRSADFFDVEKFPTMTFKSTGVQVVDENVANITGDLTIRDVTKTVVLPMEFTGESIDPFGNTRIGFEGAIDVNRKDFGLTWNAALETGGLMVSDKIKIELDISMIKQA